MQQHSAVKICTLMHAHTPSPPGCGAVDGDAADGELWRLLYLWRQQLIVTGQALRVRMAGSRDVSVTHDTNTHFWGRPPGGRPSFQLNRTSAAGSKQELKAGPPG